MFVALISTVALCSAPSPRPLPPQDTSPELHHWVRYHREDHWTQAWKVSVPTAASDHFSVDFGHSLDGRVLTAIGANAAEFDGVPGTMELALVENCAPGVPDLTKPLVQRKGTVPAHAGPEPDAYSLACIPAGSATLGYSVTATFPAGDTHVWLGSDSRGGSGTTSYFTTTSYAGCAAFPFSGVDLHLSVGVHPGVGLYCNGQTSASVTQDGGAAALVFHGPAPRTPGVLFLLRPFVQSILTIRTDDFAPGPCPWSWALRSTFLCDDPAPLDLTFGHFYADLTDLRPSGRPKVKLSTAGLHVEAAYACHPYFGVKDDCIEDSTAWKVQNPAGPSDWFHVNHGTVDGLGVSLVTGLEIGSWDFCGTGPSWAEIGVYPSDLVLDPSGCTPDLSRPLSRALDAAMPPGSSGWGCPLTYYDLPDFSPASGTVHHAATHWRPGDSCIWISSDTDGNDDERGTPIPNNGCCSLFSLDAYNTPAVHFSAANWILQIRWQ